LSKNGEEPEEAVLMEPVDWYVCFQHLVDDLSHGSFPKKEDIANLHPNLLMLAVELVRVRRGQ
jgi:hypothetical protein